MKIAIIGAGPAGMTAAYQLSKALGGKVKQLDLYEISGEVGGLSRSVELWGQTVDMGPHRFFSQDTRINSLWLEVVKDRYEIVDRQTRIFYKKKFFDYPIKAFNALSGLGLFEAARCVISYGWAQVKPPKDPASFEGWITSRFGKRLFSIFFKTYTERLWGLPTSELDADFAKQRIKKFSLMEAIKNALSGGKGNKHATLVDQFAYPTGGTGSVYKYMREAIEKAGGRVHLRQGVERVVTDGDTVKAIRLENGEEREYDHVISTMPISLMVQRLPEVPAKILEHTSRLSYRNTLLVYLNIPGTGLFPDQWLYIHDPSVEFGRITNFRNWTSSLYGDSPTSILCLEYWCNPDDRIWNMEEEELVKMASEEVVRAGLVPGGLEPEGKVIRLPRCYPVYFRDYRKELAPVEEYLKTRKRLHVIGRYGAYKYNNQDHSILMGMRAAENILDDAGHDLWEINTDYEVYQEASVITKTGLARKPAS